MDGCALSLELGNTGGGFSNLFTDMLTYVDSNLEEFSAKDKLGINKSIGNESTGMKAISYKRWVQNKPIGHRHL